MAANANDLLLQVRLLFNSGAAATDINRLQREIVGLRTSISTLQNVDLSRIGQDLSQLRLALSAAGHIDLSGYQRQITALLAQQRQLADRFIIPLKFDIANAKLDKQAIVNQAIAPELTKINGLLAAQSATLTGSLYQHQAASRVKQQNLLKERAALLQLQAELRRLQELEKSGVGLTPPQQNRKDQLPDLIRRQQTTAMEAQAEQQLAAAAVIGSQKRVAAKQNEIAKSREVIRVHQDEIRVIDQQIAQYQTQLAAARTSEAAIRHDLTLTRDQRRAALDAAIAQQAALRQQIVGSTAQRGAVLETIAGQRANVNQLQAQVTQIRLLSAGMRLVGGMFGGVRDTVLSMLTPFGNLAKVMAGVMMFKLSYDTVSSFFTANRQVEDLRRGLTALFGDMRATFNPLADLRLDQLFGASTKYGLELKAISQQFLELQAAAKGTAMEGQPVMELFEAMSAAMAVLGGSPERTQRAFLAVTQMLSKGKIYAEEMRQQLSEQLPGAMQDFAKAVGMPVDQMLAAMSKGQVGVEALIPLTAVWMSKYGEAAKIADTFTQRLNRLSTSFTLLGRAVGESGVWEWFKRRLTDTTDLVTRLSAGMGGVGTRFTAEFEALGRGLPAGLGEALTANLWDSWTVPGAVATTVEFIGNLPFVVGNAVEVTAQKLTDLAQEIQNVLALKAQLAAAEQTAGKKPGVWSQLGTTVVQDLNLAKTGMEAFIWQMGESFKAYQALGSFFGGGQSPTQMLAEDLKIFDQLAAQRTQPLSFAAFFADRPALQFEDLIDPALVTKLRSWTDLAKLEMESLARLASMGVDTSGYGRPLQAQLAALLTSTDYQTQALAAVAQMQADENLRLQQYQTYLQGATAAIEAFTAAEAQRRQAAGQETSSTVLQRQRDAQIAEVDLYRFQLEMAHARSRLGAESTAKLAEYSKAREEMTKAEAKLTLKQTEGQLKAESDLYEMRRLKITQAISAGYGYYGVQQMLSNQRLNPNTSALDRFDAGEQRRLLMKEEDLSAQNLKAATLEQTELVFAQRKAYLEAAQAVAKRRGDETGIAQITEKRNDLFQEEFDQLAKTNQWKTTLGITLEPSARLALEQELAQLQADLEENELKLKLGIQGGSLQNAFQQALKDIQYQSNGPQAGFTFQLPVQILPVLPPEAPVIPEAIIEKTRFAPGALDLNVPPLQVRMEGTGSLGTDLLDSYEALTQLMGRPLRPNIEVGSLEQLRTLLANPPQDFASLLLDLTAVSQQMRAVWGADVQTLDDLFSTWQRFQGDQKAPRLIADPDVAAMAALVTTLRRVQDGTAETWGRFAQQTGAAGDALTTIQAPLQSVGETLSTVREQTAPLTLQFTAPTLPETLAQVEALKQRVGEDFTLQVQVAQPGGQTAEGWTKQQTFTATVTLLPKADVLDRALKDYESAPHEFPIDLTPIVKPPVGDDLKARIETAGSAAGQALHQSLSAELAKGLADQGVTLQIDRVQVPDANGVLRELRRLTATSRGLSFPIQQFTAKQGSFESLVQEGNRYLASKPLAALINRLQMTPDGVALLDQTFEDLQQHGQEHEVILPFIADMARVLEAISALNRLPKEQWPVLPFRTAFVLPDAPIEALSIPAALDLTLPPLPTLPGDLLPAETVRTFEALVQAIGQLQSGQIGAVTVDLAALAQTLRGGQSALDAWQSALSRLDPQPRIADPWRDLRPDGALLAQMEALIAQGRETQAVLGTPLPANGVTVLNAAVQQLNQGLTDTQSCSQATYADLNRLGGTRIELISPFQALNRQLGQTQGQLLATGAVLQQTGQQARAALAPQGTVWVSPSGFQAVQAQAVQVQQALAQTRQALLQTGSVTIGPPPFVPWQRDLASLGQQAQTAQQTLIQIGPQLAGSLPPGTAALSQMAATQQGALQAIQGSTQALQAQGQQTAQARQEWQALDQALASAQPPVLVLTVQDQSLAGVLAKVEALRQRVQAPFIATVTLNHQTAEGWTRGQDFRATVTLIPDTAALQQKLQNPGVPTEVVVNMTPIVRPVLADDLARRIEPAGSQAGQQLAENLHQGIVAGMQAQGVQLRVENIEYAGLNGAVQEARRLVATGPGLSFPIESWTVNAGSWDEIVAEGNRYIKAKPFAAEINTVTVNPAGVKQVADQTRNLMAQSAAPLPVTLPLSADAGPFRAALNALRAAEEGQHLIKTVDYRLGDTSGLRAGSSGHLSGISGYAFGGLIPGGFGGGDIVPAWLEPGEFVLNKWAVRRLGLASLREWNGGLRPPEVPHFAQGGVVPQGGMTTIHLTLGNQRVQVYGAQGQAQQLVGMLNQLARAVP